MSARPLQVIAPRRTHNFERDPHGHYVEPQWCSTRSFEAESFGAPRARIFDPACGWGRILRAAWHAGFMPIGGDVVDCLDRNGLGDVAFHVNDFAQHSPIRAPWSVVCNPPFDHIQEFCERAVDIAVERVAMLVPLRRLPAARWLQRLPLRTVYLLTPRPSMPPASWIAAGNEPGGRQQDFCWLVFDKRMAASDSPRLRWLYRDVGYRHVDQRLSECRGTRENRT